MKTSKNSKAINFSLIQKQGAGSRDSWISKSTTADVAVDDGDDGKENGTDKK